MATIIASSIITPKTAATATTTKITKLQPQQQQQLLLPLKSLPKSLILSSATLLASITAADFALAAEKAAEGGDNRGLALLLPIIPALGWVLYNILGPALGQINRMRDTRGVIIGLSAAAAAEGFLYTPNASAMEIAEISEASSGDNRGLLLLFVITPALGWVLYNILQPALNQLNKMRSS